MENSCDTIKDVNNESSLLFFLAMLFSTLFMFRGLTLWPPYTELITYFELFAWVFSSLLLLTSIQHYSPKGKLLILFALPLTLIIGANCDRLEFLFFSYALIIGAKNCQFMRVMRFHFLISLSFCLLNIIGNYAGYIEDATFLDQSDRMEIITNSVFRKSFGYDWCTDFASHVFLILLSFWVIKRGLLNIIQIVIFFAISIFLLLETGTRMASGVILLLIVFSFYWKWRKKNIENVSKITWALFAFSTPLFALLSVYLTVGYKSYDVTWLALNIIMSNRLELGQDAMVDKGFSWFGQEYKMYGMGNSGGGIEYNYIDNTYIQFFVIVGLVATLAFVFCYLYFCYKAYKRKDLVLLFAVFVSSLFGVITQFHFNFAFCPLILGTFAAFDVHASHSPENINADEYVVA